MTTTNYYVSKMLKKVENELKH